MSYGEALKRVSLSFLFHFALALLVYVVLMQISQDTRILSQSILDKLVDNPAALDQRLSDVRGALCTTGALAVMISFVFSGVWLVLAERSMPVDDPTSRSQTASWGGLMLLAMAAAMGLGWWQIIEEGLDGWLAPGVLGARAAIVFSAVFLAYYFSTAIFVKRSMRASVPLALILPLP